MFGWLKRKDTSFAETFKQSMVDVAKVAANGGLPIRWVPKPVEPPKQPLPADLLIEDGKVLNLGDGAAIDVVIELDGQPVATLERLPSGHQWERTVPEGAIVRWQNEDGSEHATTV